MKALTKNSDDRPLPDPALAELVPRSVAEELGVVEMPPVRDIAAIGSAFWIFASIMIWRGRYWRATIAVVAGGLIGQLPDLILGPI